MAQLLIRDLDPSVVNHLKQRAKLHHRSLQSELKYIVESSVMLTLKEALQMSKKWHKRLKEKTFTDSAEQQREDRDR